MKTRVCLFVALLCLFCFPALAQDSDSPKPDRWHNLILDQSTPEDVTKELGKPKSDKVFGGKAVATRGLTYKNVGGMSDASLYFRDGKLVSISLKPQEKINADALPNIYGIQFVPKFSGLGEAMNPQDYERNQGRAYAKTYPAVYSLVAFTERSKLECLIANNSFGAIMKQGAGIRDEGGFPGHAVLIQLQSRTLDDRKGADVLK